MTDAEKKVLEGFLSKTLKIDTEEMASLYNDAGELSDLSKAAEADSARIKKLKDDASSQHKRGLKEGASKVENELKDKYEVDSDLIGVELVDFILGEKIKETKSSDEDITKHPEFIRSKLEFDKLLKAKDKEWQKKFEDQDVTYKKQFLFSKVKEKALVELDGLRPILPEDGKKAQRWKDKFVEEFQNFEYQEQDGTIVVLKEGKPLTDSHGYSKSFADHVKDTASDFFEFQASSDRSSPANRTQQQTQTVTIKNDAEYVAAMREAKTPQDRIKIMEGYVKK